MPARLPLPPQTVEISLIVPPTMNFFAHALHCLDDPYQLAGVAAPDWLNAIRPRVRCRTKHALPFIDAERPELRAMARGVVRHHEDDDWFHQTRAFAELSLSFAKRIRAATGDPDGMRPSFVGHILVELLLDAELIAVRPGAIDRYYDSVVRLDAPLAAACVSRMTGAPAGDVNRVIDRFASEQFLIDYLDDLRLCYRLNQVMRRVGLTELPESVAEMLPEARFDVRGRQRELLTPSCAVVER